jgi:hypothetical protein
MQRDDDLEPKEPYDPDDWGAPLPQTMRSVAPSRAAPASASPGALDREKLGPSRQGVEGDADLAAPARQIGEPLAAAPAKRRKGPARVEAGRPVLTLPHASKLDLIPAVFSRGALFRVGGSDDKPIAAPAGKAATAIEAQGGINLTLAGPWPRMRDKAVWEIAIEMAKASPDAGSPIPVNLSEFAKRLGYVDKGGATLDWIWASLLRLSHCRVEFDSPSATGPRLAGKLLLSARKMGARMEIEIDPAFLPRLLGEDFQFFIDRERRARLSTALARWLHDFLSTHSTQSRPFGLPYLRGLCGYGASKRRFPADLDRALAELVLVAPEILASYSFDKATRSSDRWTLALVCGVEKRRFEQPAPNLGAGSKFGGRGGVAL